MPATWFHAIGSVVLVSLISLIGIVTISVNEQRLKRVVFVLVSLAAGGLFGDAFIHLLPEAYEMSRGGMKTSVCVLAGLFAFFVLEKFLRWKHVHSLPSELKVQPAGWLNLFADGAHNLIDGMLIGASYLAGFQVGMATTIAVVLHEIPQEIGDFGVLIQSGMGRARALLYNYLSASLAIVGAIIALLIGAKIEGFASVMLPVTAGSFIYIAGSDLLPELHRESDLTKSVIQIVAMAAGVALMLTLAILE
jgi:zinc and cadmium transporter